MTAACMGWLWTAWTPWTKWTGVVTVNRTNAVECVVLSYFIPSESGGEITLVWSLKSSWPVVLSQIRERRTKR